MKNISFAITASTEHLELNKLLYDLCEVFTENDNEIVIQVDSDTVTEKVKYTINHFIKLFPLFHDRIKYVSYPLRKDGKADFAAFKNNLTNHCKGDYIFQIDADERIHPTLLVGLRNVIESTNADLIVIPRYNTVNGITPEYIEAWGWNVLQVGSDKVINYPDAQGRIYKRSPDIKWFGNVHERILGHKTEVNLADMIVGLLANSKEKLDVLNVQRFCLIHEKDLDKQVEQNKFYASL